MEEQQSAYLNVPALLDEIGLMRGQIVADLGCGSGYVTFPAARRVAPGGTVYAVDVQKHVIKNIKAKANLENVGNVVPVWTDLEIIGAARKIANNSLDWALLVNTLFQSKKHKEMLREATRMVKPGGGILIVEWKKEITPFGPQLESRLAPSDITAMAEEIGLAVDREFVAGTYHWGLILRKA